MRNASRLINEQKAAVIVEHLTYSAIDETYGIDIFTTREGRKGPQSAPLKVNRHIYDYVFTDSKNGTELCGNAGHRDGGGGLCQAAEQLHHSDARWGLHTRLGHRLQEGHGQAHLFHRRDQRSMSSLEFREIEQSKIGCARKFFHKITSDTVKYEVVDGYEELLRVMQG